MNFQTKLRMSHLDSVLKPQSEREQDRQKESGEGPKKPSYCLVCRSWFLFPYVHITSGGSNETQCEAVAMRIAGSGFDPGVCGAKCWKAWSKERNDEARAATMEYEARMFQ